jgi:hypothetical protein
MGFQFLNFKDNYVQAIAVNQTQGRPMAVFLRETVPEGETIATHDIGNIGYGSEREVIDLVGLVNPDVMDYHDGRRYREYIDEVQPDYLVVFPGWEKDILHIGIGQSPLLFQEVARFPGGGSMYVVYKTNY